MELGMARPFRIGATGGPGLLLQAGPITPTLRRDVPLSMCGWRVSADDVLQRHGAPSQAGPAGTPENIEDQQLSDGFLREVSMNWGTPSLASVINRMLQKIFGVFLRLCEERDLLPAV
jgi:hypothetical protein